jgi:cytochrome c peroxidase
MSNAVAQRNLPQARALFNTAALHMKSAEWLAEYTDPEFMTMRINGAPLPKQDPQETRVKVLSPKGFQALEEQLFADEPAWAKADTLAQMLTADWIQWQGYLKQASFTQRMAFEAARLEVIRVMALGITGFDAPVQDNGIVKSAQAMQPVFRWAQAAAEENKKLDKAIYLEIKRLNKLNSNFFKNTDFETFDRLEYIKQVLNPLFAQLAKLQSVTGVEFRDETESLPTRFNHRSTSLFGVDLFHVDAFTKISPDRLTPNKVALGKQLFFSDDLSGHRGMNCGTCHQPEKAFTDGLPKSLALDGQSTVKRNAPTLLNGVLATAFFLDLRAAKPEDQIDHVITSPHEFNTNYAAIQQRMQANGLDKAFYEAFPERSGAPIDRYMVNEALTAYFTTLVDFNSPVDAYINQQTTALDPAAKRGFNLFMGKAACGTCHFAPTFSGLVPPQFDDTEAEVLGVPTQPQAPHELDPDWGRGGGLLKFQSEIYRHAFKTVTVRNIAHTAPYFHNGAYNTLEEVVDFYNNGGGVGLGLDVPNQTLPADSLHLSDQEQKDLIAFMQALTGQPLP